MKRSDFNYYLPENLIAQFPIEPRDSSRMLVYDKLTGEREDKHFYDLPNYLKEGDVVVVNNTRVIPARLIGRKPTGAVCEVLLLKRLDYTTWEAIVKPGKRLQEGSEIIFSDKLKCVVAKRLDDGGRHVKFEFDGVFEDVLNELGEVPLPPYIKEKLNNAERYQTVYSKIEGSAAAPTAGLHFTPEIIEKLKQNGVIFTNVLLHVGLSTFRPVKEDDVTNHKMHYEYYAVSKETADIVNKAKEEGRRVVAIGTTVVRVLESVADDKGFLRECEGETDIFIYPPYKPKAVDCLLTNFHLPESTLIMLVSAFVGRDETLALYEHAVKDEYRFFSFGDCMFLQNFNLGDKQ
ncbi:MAG: tRNA preQ1(34) S-adenosylmethionine ribosyltransferase-isomerase QueA [Clostridia bacterium]|nr:tRNA preQ1(34) S-adenosylmethionine ribosyltransferase-isomerase QueA [Clostridia bacterium]